jgi:hypothetical protein
MQDHLLVHAAHLTLSDLVPELHLVLLGYQEPIALALLVALRELRAQIETKIAVELFECHPQSLNARPTTR